MTDININVDLGLEKLIDKVKQKAAEARKKERSFVPETLADSSILPGRDTRASSDNFSTDRYTSTQSLSRGRIVGATRDDSTSFARSTFKALPDPRDDSTSLARGENLADQELRRPTRRRDIIIYDEPSPLLFGRSEVEGAPWYFLWDYVRGSGYPGPFSDFSYELADAPVAFFGGTEIDNAIVNNPRELERDDNNIIGPTDTELLWASSTGAVRTMASGPFGTYVVLDDPVFDPEADPILPFYRNGIAVEAFFNTDVYQYTEFSEAGKPIVTGTLEADFWFDTADLGRYSYFQVRFYNADQNRYAAFGINIGFIYPDDTYETGIPLVDLGAVPTVDTDTADLDDYRVREIIPSAPARWYRLSFTMDTDICYAHLDGKYIGSCLPGYQPTSTDGKFRMQAGGGRQYPYSDTKPNRLGRCRFTNAILYDNTSYVVEAID